MGYLVKKRIEELDIAKGLAILGVIMVHIPIEWRLFSRGINFHLTVFFMVSGFFLWNRDNSSFSLLQSVSAKTKSLLYPYLMLSIVYCLFVMCIYLIAPNAGIESIFQVIYRTIIGVGVGTLWFLPTLYGAIIVSMVIKERFRGRYSR